MKEFTKIDRGFWESDEARDMTPEEKYFWMYIQSNANVNTLGCYIFRMRRAMDETGYNQETIEKLLHRMVELDRIAWDVKTGEVFIPHFAEMCWNRMTATVRALNSDFKSVKSQYLQEMILPMMIDRGIPMHGVFGKKEEKEPEETTENNLEQFRTPKNKRGEEEEEEEDEEEKRKTEKKKAEKPSFIPAVIDGDVYSLEFQQFWNEYPNKKNKGTAVNRWDKLKITPELFRKIMEGLARAKKSHEWNKDGGEYIPHPATWLNARGWENEYKPMPGGGQPTPAPNRPQTNDALASRRVLMG